MKGHVVISVEALKGSDGLPCGITKFCGEKVNNLASLSWFKIRIIETFSSEESESIILCK